MKQSTVNFLSTPTMRRVRIAWMGTAAMVAALGTGMAQAADPAAGWYGGLSLNSTGLGVHSGDIDSALANQGISSSSNLDKHDTTMGFQLGYRLHPNFAVEGGYTDLGKYGFSSATSAPAVDSLNGNWKAHAWSLSGLGIMPLADKWSAFGRLGVTRTTASFGPMSQTGAVATGNTSHDGTGLVFGAGANYDFSRNWFGRAEIDRYTNVGDSSTGKGNVDVLSVGAGLKF